MANASETPFHHLMHDVLDNLGLAGTPASESGIYTIGVDKKIEIHIATPDDITVLLFSSVHDYGADGLTLPKAKLLLARNAMQTAWAPTVWLSSENKAVVWTKKALNELTPTRFLELFDAFLDQALDIYDEIHGKHTEPEGTARQTVGEHYLLGMKA